MNLPNTIKDALVFLKSAKCPEDIFGLESEIKSVFRELAMLVHEDKAVDSLKPIAHEAFLLLTKWNGEAGDKVKAGTYGDKKPSVIATIATKTASYDLFTLILEGDIANFYIGQDKNGKKVLIKISNSPKDNDLMKNEADILAKLPATLDPKHAAYFPNLLDSFEINNPRQRVNIFDYSEGAVTLREVREAYPDGINPADAAWMWNRCLEALHLLHIYGYVHASVTPDSFIIVPETHQGMLIDFCYAVKYGENAVAYSDKWENNYAPETFQKKPLDFSSDIYNASFLLEYLINKSIPTEVNNIIKACRLGQTFRPKSAEGVYGDIAKIWRRLYGPKKFREFKMPDKSI